MLELLCSVEYEAQYSEWLQYSNSGGTVIQNGAKLVPTGMFAWPLPDYMEITSGFGMRLHPVYNVDKMHTGIDVAAPIGADFVAMADGKVTFAKYTDGYGNMVMIDHGNGISTLYAHGSQILVNVGDEVTKGTPVLKVGSTGVSTGPHAHFEIRINGNFIDPQDYFEQEDIENDNNSETNTTNEEIKQDTEKQENVTEENGKEVDKYGPIIYG